MSTDVIIVGAGVSGLMTAIELAESGASCLILEKGFIGRESSWAGGGILSPLYPWRYPDAINALANWGQQRYPEYFSRLHEQTGINPEWLSCGHLILDEPGTTDSPEYGSFTSWASHYQANLQQINRSTLTQLEPLLSDRFIQGLWLPDIGQVRNPRLIQALRVRAMQLGVSIREETPVLAFRQSRSQVSQVETSHDIWPADHFVISTGAWAGLPLESDFQLPPIEPVKGQMIQFQADPASIRTVVLYNDHYIIPRKDGKVLAGSTMEHTGFDKSTDAEAAEFLQQAAFELFPILKDCPLIHHWAGLRPGNTRQIPYICQHPDIGNLYFNTGHFRNGIILGLASARLCADLIMQRTPILEPSPYTLR